MPYKGASQGIMDLVAGHIFFSAQTVSSTASQIRGGALAAIAHSGRERLPDFADVPTLKEMGHDVVATTWFSISGPAGLPKDITEKMNREIIRAVSKPEVQARLRNDGLVAETMSVAAVARPHRGRNQALEAGARSARTDRQVTVLFKSSDSIDRKGRT